jgi:hypothetical protein
MAGAIAKDEKAWRAQAAEEELTRSAKEAELEGQRIQQQRDAELAEADEAAQWSAKVETCSRLAASETPMNEIQEEHFEMVYRMRTGKSYHELHHAKAKGKGKGKGRSVPSIVPDPNAAWPPKLSAEELARLDAEKQEKLQRERAATGEQRAARGPAGEELVSLAKAAMEEFFENTGQGEKEVEIRRIVTARIGRHFPQRETDESIAAFQQRFKLYVTAVHNAHREIQRDCPPFYEEMLRYIAHEQMTLRAVMQLIDKARGDVDEPFMLQECDRMMKQMLGRRGHKPPPGSRPPVAKAMPVKRSGGLTGIFGEIKSGPTSAADSAAVAATPGSASASSFGPITAEVAELLQPGDFSHLREFDEPNMRPQPSTPPEALAARRNCRGSSWQAPAPPTKLRELEVQNFVPSEDELRSASKPEEVEKARELVATEVAEMAALVGHAADDKALWETSYKAGENRKIP